MSSRLYIGRLSYHVRERDIERFFKNYGRIRELLLKNGYGFVVSIVIWFSITDSDVNTLIFIKKILLTMWYE